ncbi:WD40 repeat domain-containing protein [Ferruginivarius sediminum]|uniref:WD40 repeat domain-containing protein n=1 Tax=Ferruginivarius sediminum TaxID=2661937 RepID=A0A369T9C1_9PROT|nr:WD40 repeat domain-containing protein [Ferruginivarius sediminum]RDD61890.1 WD40 repeat domain-containing protein [Ferruginivarius sediminum]
MTTAPMPRGRGDAFDSGSREADTFLRHRGPVTGVAMIPGTSHLVSAAYDSAVASFDLVTHEAQLLGYHRHLVNQIAVEPNGRRFATCSSDYTIGIWDAHSGKPIRVLLGHADDAEAFVFIDDLTGASASRDRRILIWDLTTGAILRVLEGHEKDVLSLTYHDGRLYSSGDDMTLRVWDVASGKLLRTIGPFENETDTCAVDTINGHVALGCDDGCIRVLDIADGSLVKEIPAHGSGIKKVVASPANGDLVSAGYDQRVLLWDGATLEQKASLERHPSMWERSLNWSPDGTRLIGGTFDGTAIIWSTDGALEQEIGDQTIAKGNACLNEVAGADSGRIATCSDDGYIRLGRLSPDGGEVLETVEPLAGRMLMNAVTLDEASGLVVAGAHNQKLHIFDIDGDSLTNEREVALGEGPINSIRVAHHSEYAGESFVACYSGAIVRVVREGHPVGRINLHEGAVKSLCLHPREALGVSCGADGLLMSWTFDGRLLQRFLGHTAIINDVDISPSGDRLVSVSRDFTVKVFDLESGVLLQSIEAGHRSLKSVCFADDGYVVVGDYWGGIIGIDLESETLERRTIAQNGISGVSRADDLVAACSYDGSVYLVRPKTLEVANTLCVMRQHVAGWATVLEEIDNGNVVRL